MDAVPSSQMLENLCQCLVTNNNQLRVIFFPSTTDLRVSIIPEKHACNVQGQSRNLKVRIFSTVCDSKVISIYFISSPNCLILFFFTTLLMHIHQQHSALCVTTPAKRGKLYRDFHPSLLSVLINFILFFPDLFQNININKLIKSIWVQRKLGSEQTWPQQNGFSFLLPYQGSTSMYETVEALQNIRL